MHNEIAKMDPHVRQTAHAGMVILQTDVSHVRHRLLCVFEFVARAVRILPRRVG